MLIKPDWSRLLHRLLVILPYTGLPTNDETVKTKVETNIKEYFMHILKLI